MSQAVPSVTIDVPDATTHFYLRRSEAPLLYWPRASAPVPRVDGFIDELRRSAPPGHARVFAAFLLVVRGLAPAWPRFGAAVAGLCHRAAMVAAMDIAR